MVGRASCGPTQAISPSLTAIEPPGRTEKPRAEFDRSSGNSECVTPTSWPTFTSTRSASIDGPRASFDFSEPPTLVGGSLTIRAAGHDHDYVGRVLTRPWGGRPILGRVKTRP